MSKLTISEYRDVLDSAAIMVRDYSACVGYGERVLWVERALRCRGELNAAKCSRRNVRDMTRHADLSLRLCTLISEVLSASKAADANFQNMAFAGEWR